MKRQPFILFCVLCLGLGYWAGKATEFQTLLDLLRDQGPTIAALVLGGLILVVLMTWLAFWAATRLVQRVTGSTGAMTEAEIVQGLVDHFTTPEGQENPTPEDRRRAALTNLGLWLARRQAVQFSFNATVTVVGGLVGAATLFLLYEQNVKLDEQNRRMTLQTDANITESVLLEGARRAAQTGDLNQLFDDIAQATRTETKCATLRDTDCWIDRDGDGYETFVLPNWLQALVTDILSQSTPYRVAVARSQTLDFEERLRTQYDFPNASPERGQILLVLKRYNIDIKGMEFHQALLTGSNFESARLRKIDLRGAILANTDLTWANFSDTLLMGTDLSGALLYATDFSEAALTDATLPKNGSLIDLIMEGTGIVDVDLEDRRFKGGNLRNVKFARSYLHRTNFNQTDLSHSNFSTAFIGGADFSTANLDGVGGVDLAWWWADTPPPIGWPYMEQSLVCVFDPANHVRTEFPQDCSRTSGKQP